MNAECLRRDTAHVLIPLIILCFPLFMLCYGSLCLFLIFLFSSKLFRKCKSLLSSFNFLSVSSTKVFFVFGSLLALTNSETYTAAAYMVLISSVKSRISIFSSRQLTLFTAHFTFAFLIPGNDLNLSFSFLSTNIGLAQIFHSHLFVKLYHVKASV